MNSISSKALIERTNDIVSSEIDGETVMMSIEQGKYYGMDSIGSRIWELIEKPILLSDLCNTLTSEFQVNEATCSEDVTSFIEQLMNEKLVKITPEQVH